jgi:hypothetical protein
VPAGAAAGRLPEAAAMAPTEGVTMRSVPIAAVVAMMLTIGDGGGATTVPVAESDESDANVTGDSDVNATALALAEFRERLDEYMELREEVADEVADADDATQPAAIRAREEALAKRIRARRAHAGHGDIFTPEIRIVFRRLLRPELNGEDGGDIRFTLQDDAPSPDAVPIEVNARYPAGLPFPTTPAPLLLALPPLPPILEYRIIGKDLILLDQPADVILDFIRNAIG